MWSLSPGSARSRGPVAESSKARISLSLPACCGCIPESTPEAKNRARPLWRNRRIKHLSCDRNPIRYTLQHLAWLDPTHVSVRRRMHRVSAALPGAGTAMAARSSRDGAALASRTPITLGTVSREFVRIPDRFDSGRRKTTWPTRANGRRSCSIVSPAPETPPPKAALLSSVGPQVAQRIVAPAAFLWIIRVLQAYSLGIEQNDHSTVEREGVPDRVIREDGRAIDTDLVTRMRWSPSWQRAPWTEAGLGDGLQQLVNCSAPPRNRSHSGTLLVQTSRPMYHAALAPSARASPYSRAVEPMPPGPTTGSEA